MSSETGPEDTPAAARTDDRAAARRGVLAAALVVVIVVLGGLVGWLGFRAYERRQDDSARTQAVAAARQSVQNFVSLSAATIDRDLDRVSSGATGDFADQFDTAKARVKSLVVTNKVRQIGSVVDAAPVASDRDSATVLVVADATTYNVSAPKGQLRHYRVQVDMAKIKGAWRVSTLQFVG
jgi:Mce-associated membrane protein